MDKIKFKRYNSIKNSYRQKLIDKIVLQDTVKNRLYYITEKIHGCNMSFYINKNKEYKIGKRSGFINEGENFYNSSSLLDSFKKKLSDAVFYIEDTLNIQVEELYVYGELFGGNYSHPDIEKSRTAKKIQKGVDYHPDNMFLAFDIRVNDQYLSRTAFEGCCGYANIPYIPTLFTGTLKECLDYPNEFQTTIPERYGLPPIENNNCEGVVIAPVEPYFLGDTRVILKNKNEKFTEKSNEGKKEKVELEISPELKACMETISCYINENRLSNVLSKHFDINTLTMKDFGSIMKELCLDALGDFTLDHDYFTTLSAEDVKRVKKYMNSLASQTVKKYMMKNV